MKKTLLPLIASCLLFACNNKADKKTGNSDTTPSKNESVKPAGDKSIVGKWKPVRSELPKLSEEEKQTMLSDLTLEFTADGNFITTMKTETKTGTYQYNEQAATLNTKITGGKEETFRVEWEDGLVTLVNDEGKVTMKRLE